MKGFRKGPGHECFTASWEHWYFMVWTFLCDTLMPRIDSLLFEEKRKINYPASKTSPTYHLSFILSLTSACFIFLANFLIMPWHCSVALCPTGTSSFKHLSFIKFFSILCSVEILSDSQPLDLQALSSHLDSLLCPTHKLLFVECHQIHLSVLH